MAAYRRRFGRCLRRWKRNTNVGRRLNEVTMPFIHIKSLPLDRRLDMAKVVADISKDFADAVAVKLKHVTATWEYFTPDHYASAGAPAKRQPRTTHPVLVDLLVPDFNAPSRVEKLLRTVARSVAKRAKVPEKNIFINLRQAHSGMVFDAGNVVHW